MYVYCNIHKLVCVCVFAQLCPTLFDPSGLQPARLLCPWDSPCKKIGVDCHFLLQGIFPIQGSNLCLLPWQGDSSPLSHLRSPYICIWHILYIMSKFFRLVQISSVLFCRERSSVRLWVTKIVSKTVKSHGSNLAFSASRPGSGSTLTGS